MLRKQVQERFTKKRSAQLVEKTYQELQVKATAENEVVQQIYKHVAPTLSYKQVTTTFAPVYKTKRSAVTVEA